MTLFGHGVASPSTDQYLDLFGDDFSAVLGIISLSILQKNMTTEGPFIIGNQFACVNVLSFYCRFSFISLSWTRDGQLKCGAASFNEGLCISFIIKLGLCFLFNKLGFVLWSNVPVVLCVSELMLTAV